MKITEAQIETALGFLVETSHEHGDLVEQVGKKKTQLNAGEALLMVQAKANGTPATLCEAAARADPRWTEWSDELAMAEGALAVSKARRGAAETTISVYQSMVKDRQGARP